MDLFDQSRRRHRPFVIAAILLALISLVAAACGGDETATTGDDDTSVSTQAPAGGDDTDSDGDTGSDGDAADGNIIGTANLNGEVVDPKPHAIDGIAIAESYPEQLMVSFTAGDENCLAADARAEAIGDDVVVTLEVGITTDAAARSCLAGEFPHTLSIALDEGLDGRSVVAATP